MTNTLPFSTFTKQSKKGIVVLYIDSLYAFLKATWILFLVFFQKFSDFTGNKLTYIYIGIAVLIILLFLTAYLRFINFKFKVNNGHFILKKGVFKKTNTAIPFDRIQNINFKQNIIQQLINVHEVNIETAGSTKAEVSIKALSYKNAKALKELLSVYTSSIKKEPEVDVAKKTPLLNINFFSTIKGKYNRKSPAKFIAFNCHFTWVLSTNI
jgi:Predicted membrane protein